MQKAKKILDSAIYFIFAAICVFGLFFSARHTVISVLSQAKTPFIYFQTVLFVLLISGIMLMASYFMLKLHAKSELGFLFALSVLFLVLCGIWSINTVSEPVSDYAVLLNGARAILDGDFIELSSDKSNYFYLYNTQIPYTVFMSLVMRINSSYVFLKRFEIIIQTANIILLYYLTRKIAGKKTAAIGSVIYALLCFNIMGSLTVNNQHIALTFCLLGLIMYFKGGTKQLIASGLFFALAALMRQSSFIFVIAVLCHIAYSCLAYTNKAALLESIKKLADYVAAYVLTVTLIVYSLNVFSISPDNAYKAHLPYFKVMLGLVGGSLYGNETESAEKTKLYFDLEMNDFDYVKYNLSVKNAIMDVVKRPSVLLPKLASNARRFLGEYDNQFMFSAKYRSETVNFMLYAGIVQYIGLLLLALAAVFRRESTACQLLLIISAIGFTLVHSFIEVQSRYRYELYAVLSILAAIGTAEIYRVYKSRH